MSLSKVDLKTAVVGGAAALAVSYAIYSYLLTKPVATDDNGNIDMAKEMSAYFSDKAAAEQKTLYKKEAMQRSQDVSGVHYKLAYALIRGGGTYHGQVEITFDLTKDAANSDRVFVDYRGEQVNKLEINGKVVTEGEPFRDHRIYFAKEFLKEGQNKIFIRFVSKYVKDCQGIHHFVDKDDNEEYLYSQFEAADAHKAFPCFDQPDLKATYTLLVLVPKGWNALSTKKQSKETVYSGSQEYANQLKAYGLDEKEYTPLFKTEGVSCIEFGLSPKISCYLFSIIAGPYVTIESAKPEIQNYRFPLKLYARKSIAKYVEKAKEEYFNVTKCGIDYYEKLFSTPYPFDKLDQVFVPDYNMGAMENVGCVIYRDDYVARDETFSHSRKQSIFITFLHEISHMWFGNLVTMKWWDDLWLNESFANYVSFICLDEAPGLEEYKSSWTIFLSQSFNGLNIDQRNTTHPISVDVIHTQAAQDIFDGISYGKGAAWLNQTFNFIGREVFSIGIASYFKQYAYQNTQLPDFISHIDQAAKQLKVDIDFKKWSDSWLKVPGCNVIWHDVVEEDGKIKKFTVQQRVHEHGEGNKLRVQKYECAFYNENMEVIKMVDVRTKDDQETFDLEELVGEPAPFAYHINYGNHGYGKFKVDPKSLKALEDKLGSIKDTMSRRHLYLILNDMLKSNEITGAHFLNVIKKAIVNETSPEVIGYVMALIIPNIIEACIPSEQYQQQNHAMFELIVDKMLASGNVKEPSVQQMLVNRALSSARNEDHYILLYKWFQSGFVITSADKKLENITLSTQQKHNVVQSIWRSEEIPLAQKEAVLIELEKIDKSDRLDNTKKYCEAANPLSKQKVWDMYFNFDKDAETEKWGLHAYQHSMMGFNQPQQVEQMEKFQQAFFDNITTAMQKKGRFVSGVYFRQLRPMAADDSNIKKFVDLHAKISKDDPDNTFYLKMLKETIYDLEKKKVACEASAKYLASQ